MTIKKPVLDYAVEHWNSDFTGVSAIAVAENLNYSHDEVLAAFRELQLEEKGKVKEDVKLYSIRISDDKDTLFEESEEIDTAIFFPSVQVLTEHFYTSQLARESLPEYRTRLHKGSSQLSLVYFHISVLNKYLERPELYVVDDSVAGGIIRLNWDNEVYLADSELDRLYFDKLRYGKRILKSGEVAVAAIMNDLAELPDSEQRHWHSNELDNPDFAELDPDFYRFLLRNFEGEWIDYDDPLKKALEVIQRVNTTLEDHTLFRNVENPYLAYPVLNTYKEFCDKCSELYKVVGSDSLNAKTIKGLLHGYYGCTDIDFVHQESGRPLSTIQLLDLLAGKMWNGSLLIDVIREIGNHRVSSDHKIIEPKIPDKNYLIEFRYLVVSLLDALIAFLEGIQFIMHTMTREEAFENLENQTASLARKVETLLPQIRGALDGETALPQGCPSEESAASLIMDQIGDNLDEVIAALKMAEVSIWKKSQAE